MKSILKWLSVNGIKLVLWVVILLIPLLGVWTASSLAAFVNSIPWLAVAAGLMLFPVLPLAWDALSEYRRAKKAKAKKKENKRILTFGDRLLMRTLFVNLVFLSVFVFAFPQQLVRSLTIRGDWFLDGYDGPTAQKVREALLAAADHLEWLWKASEEDNPVEDMNQTAKQAPPPKAAELDKVVPQVDIAKLVQTEQQQRDPRKWPLEPTLSPIVVHMPKEAQGSFESVARYIESQEKDPFLRAKAIHDYIANAISYDAVALDEGRYPPQDAKTVFETKVGVCAGYANLFVAMCSAMGLEAIYVTGDSRDMDGAIAGVKHAWNAVKLDDQWHLIDATWDAGYLEGSTFVRRYTNDYLFTPPEIFAFNHLPKEEGWQLLKNPISRGEFARQVPLRPSFIAAGFELESPTRSQVTVSSALDLRIQSSGERFLLVKYKAKEGGAVGDCTVSGETTLSVTCTLPQEGTYFVQLFIGVARYGTYDFAGQIEVNKS